MKRLLAVALAALLLAAPALAYVVKLKDGTLIFARTIYSVKGTKAIITLENGTVTQYDLDKIDVPGTEEYNKKFGGNVIGLDVPSDNVLQTPQNTPVPVNTLRDLIEKKKAQVKPLPTPNNPTNAVDSNASNQTSGAAVDQPVQTAFAKFFEGAGITQFRLLNYRGNLRLLTTANTEEAVFNALSAAARAIADLNGKGRDVTLEIMLTTSGGEAGGSFLMTPAQARPLVNGQLPIADYFIKNVIF